jgi:hypothetical protein
VPSIWLLELEKLDQRMKLKDQIEFQLEQRAATPHQIQITIANASYASGSVVLASTTRQYLKICF